MIETGMNACWSIWKNRNICCHDMVCRSPKSLLVMIERMGMEFKEANSDQPREEQMIREVWRPPPRGLLKINVDASYNSKDCLCTVGTVVRNLDAEVCFSVVARFEGVQSSLQAELYAIFTGLEVARMKNLNGIQLESDCLVAVKEILKKKNPSANEEMLYQIYRN